VIAPNCNLETGFLYGPLGTNKKINIPPVHANKLVVWITIL